MVAGGSEGFDLQGLLRQAQQLQAQLQETQGRLAAEHVTGTAGGGLVTATVSGTGELVGLRIAPEAVHPQDADTLADLVLAAVRDATQAAGRLAEQRMGPLAGGLPGAGGLGPRA